MNLDNQSQKFDIPEDVIYLNTAYMSPLLKEVAQEGKSAIDQKSRPYTIVVDDFFDPLTQLKELFAQLIDCDEAERICMISSASYGIATVVNNISLNKGDEILVLEDQFPSNIYSWQRLAQDSGAELKIMAKPRSSNETGKIWNEKIIDSITDRTAVVAMCHAHWADGTLFDLRTIRKKTDLHNSLLIIDGTQSVGAFPFSVSEIKPDALICSGYKWLLGPYSSGLAYFGPYFDRGTPIEENWANRLHSENFAGLTKYEEQYKPFSNRYNVGEQANFIAVPMLITAIRQLLHWTPGAIQDYCRSISLDVIEPLVTIGCIIESPEYRGHHLFGIKLPSTISLSKLQEEFKKRNIYVSVRGDYVRVSIHLFNTKQDIQALVDAILFVHRSEMISL